MSPPPRPPDLSPIDRVMGEIDARSGGAASSDNVPTGFPSLDRLLGGGFRRGDLAVIGGDVGSGKSALALAIALRASARGQVTVFATSEMASERVLERALAIEGRASVDDLRRGTLDPAARAAIATAAVRLRDTAPIVSQLLVGGIGVLADELRRSADLGLAVVDPLQTLAAGTRTQDEEVAAAVRQLKALALELDVAVVVTSELPALPAVRADRRPTLADFGAGGAVAHHADVVLGLFREEMYDPAPAASGIDGAAELAALKNRHGPTGYVDLYFYKQWMRFEDVIEDG